MNVSEISKHRALVIGYCNGCGLDLGSGGDPIKPSAIQVELPNPYCPLFDDRYPPQLLGDATNLHWFRDGVLDYVFSSHLIEDFNYPDQERILREWSRVLRPGGHLVIIAPEKFRWEQALSAGQPPNLAHRHEPEIGDFTKIAGRIGGLAVIEDRHCDGSDYSMFFVARKL